MTVETIFADDLKRLRNFTRDCRDDMHEPDEQGISVKFPPKNQVYNLDNACTGEPTKTYRTDVGFWLVNDEGKREWFNLANIIALARRLACTAKHPKPQAVFDSGRTNGKNWKRTRMKIKVPFKITHDWCRGQNHTIRHTFEIHQLVVNRVGTPMYEYGRASVRVYRPRKWK